MSSKLSDAHTRAIERWDGEEVLLIFPNGSIGYESFKDHEEKRYDSGEFWCAMKHLDDLGVPRYDALDGRKYSIVGRIDWLMRNTKQFSK